MLRRENTSRHTVTVVMPLLKIIFASSAKSTVATNMINNSREIIRKAIEKANKMFNPSYNAHVEELTGEPNDRTAYDYAGDELQKTNFN
jgi:hypothetical protein